MTALLLVVLAQVQPVELRQLGDGCYRADDQTAGWKQAVMPKGTTLAAPPDIDQFRSGQPSWVVTDRALFDYRATTPRWGVVRLDFEVPSDTRLLRVHFLQRLEGMRVEVRGGDGSGRDLPLLPERRFSTDELRLEWTAEGVRYVTILLHHHVRGAPVVADWSSGRWQQMPAAPRAQLTYFHPGGRDLELCDAPHQPLQARAHVLTGVTR